MTTAKLTAEDIYNARHGTPEQLEGVRQELTVILQDIVDDARKLGIVVQVDIVSNHPPAMGNYRQVVSSRLVR